MTKTLLIAGGSVRAAAASAIRAGFSPWCVDCFGDADLVRACPTQVIRDYPKAIPKMLASGPADCGWMYTGAMENYPEIIAAIGRPLYGNSAETVQRVRDPDALPAVIKTKLGVEIPKPADFAAKTTLLKPRNSGGGAGIRFWNGEQFDRSIWYLQKWLDGEPMSVTFVATDHSCQSVGDTRQLIGADWLNAPGPFHYCGSIFLREISATWLGCILASDFGLRGLIGVDLISAKHDYWPIEVNPRYTASVEVIERAVACNLIAKHVDAFTNPTLPTFSSSENPFGASNHPGKAILYAPVDSTFPAAGSWDDDYPFADLRRRFADLPHPGQHIRRGQPVMTFFADGDSPMSTEAALRKIAGDLDRLLFGR